MKAIVYTVILALIIIGCGSVKNQNDVMKETATQDTIVIANDSLEYDITIIETGFYSWLATQPPRGFYNQSILENRNRFSVAEYNRRTMDPRFNRTDLYIQPINYELNVDYGYEVNYLLYNYFEFFEDRYNQRLR